MTYGGQAVLSVERHNYQTLPWGGGDDSEGGNTVQLLEYIVGRFGPITSFTSTYKADSWTLNMQRNEAPPG